MASLKVYIDSVRPPAGSSNISYSYRYSETYSNGGDIICQRLNNSTIATI